MKWRGRQANIKTIIRGIWGADMNKMPLSSTQTRALREIKTKVMADFPVVDFLLYGSAARGEADHESDVDLMIVVSEPITRFKRHEITDIVFDVNLQFGTNFSTLVVDQESWETGIISVLPLRNEIMRDGIRL
jgi:predicted nucleotidyltransferase